MVVVTLLLTAVFLSLVAINSFHNALAEGVNFDAGLTSSPSPSGQATSEPSPSLSATVDPAVILDVKLYKKKALKVEKAAKKTRARQVVLRKAFEMSPPKRLRLRSEFGTWESRWRYCKSRRDDFEKKNNELWKKMVKPPGNTGVDRWKPLLRYCGMPEGLMWRACMTMDRESHGDPTAISPGGTYWGLFQFGKPWWQGKWNPLDPFQNVYHFVKAIKKPGGWSHWPTSY
jgi:hypothetical protein